MIRDVDTVLEKVLRKSIAPSVAISFSSAEVTTSPTVRCILFDIREALRYRDETPRYLPDTEISTLRKLPPVRMDLAYLIFAESADVRDEHDLLSQVLRALYSTPFVEGDSLEGLLKEEGTGRVQIEVSQLDHRSHEQPERIFSALGLPLRPAVWAVLTASFEPYQTEVIKVVRHALASLGVLQPDGSVKVGSVSSVQVSVAGVVQTKGMPVKCATVEATGHGMETATNEHGFFSFVGIPTRTVRLKIEHPDCLSQEIEVSVPPPGRVDLLKPLKIELVSRVDSGVLTVEIGTVAPTISYSGVVYYPDGKPAKAVLIRSGRRQTITDQSGTFELSGLPWGSPEPVAEVTGSCETPLVTENGRLTLKSI
ncbi:MAG TPA: Pvc16 family protein [Fimbriimonadaceae bacterium]|nr:Pvc16 family protein [Fimbriimonadaceae bacterium]